MTQSFHQKMDRLERCLVKFRATPLGPDESFFEHHYGYFPDARRSKLGAGAYGIAYTVRSVNDHHQPAIACKVMEKTRLCNGGEHTIFHLCAEFAVLQHVAPGCQRLNKCQGLFHDEKNIYLLVSKVQAPTSSLETRLCHVYAHYYPSKLADIPSEVKLYFQQWEEQRKFLTERHKKQQEEWKTSVAGGGGGETKESSADTSSIKTASRSTSSSTLSQDAMDDGLRAMLSSQYGQFMDNTTRDALNYVGSKAEFPSSGDLFKMITHDRTFRRRGEFAHLPEPKAAVIMKQILQGLEFMHSAGTVHRDLKPENIIVGVSRSCSLLKDPSTGKCVGVQFREKIDTQIIDFGLVKHLKTQGMVQTPSPGFFGVSEATKAKASTGAGGGPAPAVAGMGLPSQPQAPAPVKTAGSGGGQWDVLKPVPAKYETQKEFNLSVTPCGTQCYMALESLKGYFDGVTGANPRWLSTSMLLPKIDVFSCGVTLYAMNHGKLPFAIDKAYREPSAQEKVQQVMQKVIAGVNPDVRLQASTRRLINAMLHNDPRVRPTVATVLNDPYFSDVTDTFIYNVDLNGDITYVVDDGEAGMNGMGTPQTSTEAADVPSPKKDEGPKEAEDDEEGGSSPLNNAEFKDLMDAMRNQEDAGQ